MAKADETLVFAHVGDLHVTTADQRNYFDFLDIVGELNEIAEELDFAVLPGDNADGGLPSQYQLVSCALDGLRTKALHIITGDHDMPKADGTVTSSLRNFYGNLRQARRLPYAETVAGVRCLFLDISGPGTGHLDFRIGEAQLRWLSDELSGAKGMCAVFMHTYPADINDPFEKAAVIKALETDGLLLVDIGHTHYNELANDGRKIFAATRSTGQIEEAHGVAGYSIATIDKTVVSWRFRPLAEGRPIVLITAPADRRLATRAKDPDHRGSRASVLRARVLWKRAIKTLRYSIDGQQPVEKTGDNVRRLEAKVDLSSARSVVVEAIDVNGISGFETVELAREADFSRFREADGSDADRVGRWIERGILGSQLGPNRNGHGW